MAKKRVSAHNHPGSGALQHLPDGAAPGGGARLVVRQLLTFAKGGTPIRKIVEIGPILQESTAFALHGSAVKAEVRVPPDLATVDADPGQLGQVVQNLVLNASQAMDGNGKRQPW